MNTNQSTAEKVKLENDSKVLSQVLDEMQKVIVGQEHMTRSLLVGLLTGGHVLLEGLPGLAKTLAVKTLAAVLDAKFQRIQFTPDLLPSDLIGTMIFNQGAGSFHPKKGPIFANIVLADEINRAPAKVQSALLEAMAEGQVTIGENTFRLEEPFLVLATQNPIEQEGTYPLPEAQMDRFLFKLKISYPTRSEERVILDRMSGNVPPHTHQIFSTKVVLDMRKHVESIYLDERIKDYILRLVAATRKESVLESSEADPKRLLDVRQCIQVGASPRATLFLTKASRAHALLEGRSYVIPDDIKTIAADILRHRLILTFDAEARGLSSDAVIRMLLDAVVVP